MKSVIVLLCIVIGLFLNGCTGASSCMECVGEIKTVLDQQGDNQMLDDLLKMQGISRLDYDGVTND